MLRQFLKSLARCCAAILQRRRAITAAQGELAERLLAAIDRFERAFQCPGALFGIFAPLAVAADAPGSPQYGVIDCDRLRRQLVQLRRAMHRRRTPPPMTESSGT